MAILDKTRKKLWAKSGNRCAICKTELFSKKKKENETNIGEECHIISSKINGPRFKSGIENYDLYSNLILLCRNHHKKVDDLTVTYIEELLRSIKLTHENWVTTTLRDSIKKETQEKPRFLIRVTSGKKLFSIIYDSYGYRTDYDEIKNEKDASFIGGVLQSIQDYGDISGQVEVYDQIQMEVELNDLLKELEEEDFYLFGERNIEKIKLGDGTVDSWAIANIIVKRKSSEDIIKVDLDNINT